MRRIILASFLFLSLIISAKAAVWTVVNTLDNNVQTGANQGDLRSCIRLASLAGGAQTINFNIPIAQATNGTYYLINISGAGTQGVPYDITGATLTIDATTQLGYSAATGPIVVINGNSAFDGIDITGGTGHTIKGLALQNLDNGIVNNAGSNLTVEGCWFGVNVTNQPTNPTIGGTTNVGYTLDLNGVLLNEGTGHIIGGATATAGAYPGNVLSGCCMEATGGGMNVNGTFYTFLGAVAINGANNVTISGNIIGLSAAGTSGTNVGNGNTEPLHDHGILIYSGGNPTTISNNVISNSTGTGIYSYGAANNITITGNMIGTDITGMDPIGNRGGGISFVNGGAGNTIGGNTPAARNIVSGNGGAADSRQCRANLYQNGACQTAPCAAACPTEYDGTLQCGIYFLNITNSQIMGNYVGTDATGNTVSIPTVLSTATPPAPLNGLGNLYAGIKIEGTSTVTVGGTSAAYGNVVGNNGFDPFVATGNSAAYLGHGIQLSDQVNGVTNETVTNTVVQYNYVGVGANGTTAMGNRQDGISLLGTKGTQILNNVSSNNAYGIFLQSDFENPLVQANNCTIYGNLIGTDATGTVKIGNGIRPAYDFGDGGGIGIQHGSNLNKIGGPATGQGNVISGNLQGIVFRSSGNGGPPINNTVQNNYIGLDINGVNSIPNTNFGIVVSQGANNNTIGGATGAGNYIANNGQSGYGAGIWLDSATSNTISYNYIGVNKSLASAPNIGDGIQITNGSQNNVIGGIAGSGNTIAYNDGNGIEILNPDAIKSYNNAINNNSIYCNSTRGIELHGLGNAPGGVAPSFATPTFSGSPVNFTITGPAGSWIELYYADTTCNNCGTSTTGKTLQGKTFVVAGASPLAFVPPAGKTNIVYVATASAINPVTNLVHNTSEFSACTTLCTITAAISPTSATICSGNSTTLTATPTNGKSPYTYLWYSGGTAISGATNATYLASPTATTTYTVTIKDANTCTATSTGVTVTVNPTPATPTVTAGGPLTFCNGGSVTLTASTGIGYTYQWYNSGTAISGATNNTYTATTSGSYTIIETSASPASCPSAASAVTTVTVNPTPTTPTVTVGGPTTFCSGGSVLLTASTGTGTYQWYNGGTAISGATSNTYKVTASGSYTIVETSASPASCPSSASAPLAVTVNPLPAFQPIVGTDPVCAGITGVIYSITATTGNTYSWTVPASVGTIVGSNTGSSISVNINAAIGSGTIKVIEKNSSLCSSLHPDSLVVTVQNSLAYQPVIGGALQCAGSKDVIYHINPTTGNTYTWTVPSSVGTIVKTNAVGDSITVNITTTVGSGTIKVTEKNSNGCSSVIPDSLLVTINPLPIKPTITSKGSTTFCSGKSDTLTTSSKGASSFQWYKNGAVISGATDSIYVATDSGYYKVIGVSSLGCNSLVSDSVQIKVNPTPIKPTITSKGSTTFCNGKSDTLTASSKGASSFQWYKNGIVISGATDSIYVATDSGYYKVIGVSSLSCNSLVSDSIQINVNPTPIKPTITSKGSTTFCSGKSDTLTASSKGASSFQWYKNGIVISGATDSVYVATDSGYYKVIGVSSLSCNSSVSDSVQIKINPTPIKPTITSKGSTTFCSGKSDTLTASSKGASSFQWYKNGAVISGSTDSIYVATDSGYYKVIGISSLSCNSLVSDSIQIKVNPTPIKPTIKSSGSTTFCSSKSDTLTASSKGASSFQWYKNGIVISGSTDSIYVPTDSGYYKVIGVSSLSCNSSVSDSVQIKINPTPIKPTINSKGSTTFCNGKSDTLTASSKGASSFQWYKNGIVINGSTDSIYVATDSGYYKVIGVSSLSCNSLVSDSVQINVNPTPIKPTITSKGSTTFCSGKSDTLTASSKGASSFQWYKNGIVISGATDSIYVATDSGYYKVIGISSLSCNSLVSDSVRIIVNPLPSKPTVNASSPAFCSGTSDTLTAISSASSGYQWYENGVAIGGATGSSYIATDSGYYQVTVTNSSVCVSPASDSAHIKVNPLPAYHPVIGDTTVCALSPIVPFSIQKTPGYTYQWSPLPKGVSFVNPPTDTSSSVSFSFDTTAGIDIIRVIETDTFGCQSFVPDSIVITIDHTPVPQFTVQQTLCSASPVLFNDGTPTETLLTRVSQIVTYTYSWNFGDTASASLDTTSFQNPEHLYNIGNKDSSTYIVKLVVTNSGGCKDSVSNPVTIFKSPMVKVFADKDSSFNVGICSGKNDLSLTDSVWAGVDTSNFHYYWTSNPKGLVLDSSDKNPLAISASGSATYYLLVTDPASNCTAEDSVSIYIKSPKVVADSTALNGKIVLCGLNDSLTFTPSITGGSKTYNYFWTLEGGQASAYFDTTALDPEFKGSTYGTFNFILTVNDKGVNCTISDSIEVTINRRPSITLGSKRDTVCAGTAISLTANTHLLDTSYSAKPYTYIWAIEDTTHKPVVYDSIHTAKNIFDTINTYQFKPITGQNNYAVAVVDANGCISNYAVDSIVSEPKQDLYFPNILTPNNDGKNDRFVVKEDQGHGDPIFPGATLEVYNRWGDRVFKAQNYPYSVGNELKWWDAHDIVEGVYYYYLKTGCGQSQYKGWVQVVSNNNTEQ